LADLDGALDPLFMPAAPDFIYRVGFYGRPAAACVLPSIEPLVVVLRVAGLPA
jgi:hypothetical protein